MEVRRASLIILYTKDGKILLQHRDENAERSPNQWGYFGGGIEDGETPEQAVRRESLEEIEYEIKNPKLIDEEAENDSPHTTQYTYAEAYDSTQPIVLHEGQGYGWFTVQEALLLPMSEHRRTCLEKLAPLIFN